MKTITKKQWALRICFYLLAMIVLALGLTLNTQSLLGSSPIISIPCTISLMTGINFGDLTLAFYVLFVFVQMIIKGKKRTWIDILQIPLSIVFTRFMNLFASYLLLPHDTMIQRLLVLAGGIILTGIGAAATVNMRLIPNPGDGLVSSIADTIQKPMGTTKNIVDICCVAISCLIGLICRGNIFIGVGLGTVAAMIGVGRSIAVFNHFFKKKMERAAGLDNVV